VVSRRELAASALLRQRRFLVLMSLALAAHYMLHIHVKGEAEYSGFAVTVAKPDRVQYCLWVVFGWALLRYIQRLNELWSKVKLDVMKNVAAEDLRLALKMATRSAIRQVNHGELASQFSNPSVRGSAWLNPSLKQMIRETRNSAPKVSKKADPDFEFTQRGGRKYRSFAIVITYNDDGGIFQQIGFDFNMPEWSRARTVLHRAHAYAQAAARLPAIFEHWAPLAIAALALCVPVIVMWVDGHKAVCVWV
jgi:hypothetical protein